MNHIFHGRKSVLVAGGRASLGITRVVTTHGELLPARIHYYPFNCHKSRRPERKKLLAQNIVIISPLREQLNDPVRRFDLWCTRSELTAEKGFSSRITVAMLCLACRRLKCLTNPLIGLPSRRCLSQDRINTRTNGQRESRKGFKGLRTIFYADMKLFWGINLLGTGLQGFTSR